MHAPLSSTLASIIWSPVTGLLARLLLVSAYLIGGFTKLADWPGAVAEQVHFGMSPPALCATATIAVELIGAALILSGRLIWLGAGLLGVFTLLAALVANDFWTMQGEARFHATNAFFEHLGLVGAFALVARLSWTATPQSQDP
jgi:uncharacterized membrane protein YphA (DoxX/SURF4 family)